MKIPYLVLFILASLQGCDSSNQRGYEVTWRDDYRKVYICQQSEPFSSSLDLKICETVDECNTYCDQLRQAAAAQAK